MDDTLKGKHKTNLPQARQAAIKGNNKEGNNRDGQ